MTKGKYALLILLVLGAGFFLFLGDSTHAADQIFITHNGEDLNPAVTYEMTTSSMQLMLRTEGTAYDDDRYKVEWTIEDATARDVIASIGTGTSKTIGIVQALSPGDVTITVTVKDSMDGDAVMGSTTCNIRVIFSIDTTTDDSIYKFVHESDTTRSLVLYADSPDVDLDLNFGAANATNTQWSSNNEEIVTVTQNGGRVTPVGAGKTQVVATYTPTGGSDTYTAYLDVYIIPKVSSTQGSGYATSVNAKLKSGEYLYTDTVFSNNLEVIRSKIVWVVKKDDAAGNSAVIADSIGKESDLISITPMASRSNELRVTGKAGEYDLYFYTYGTYDEKVDNGTIAYTPTVVHLTIMSDIKDKSEILGIGDKLNFAESYNMTTEDFMECFNVAITMAQGAPDYSEYADYNGIQGELTGKSVGELVATMSVRAGRENIVRRLLGLSENESLPQLAYVTRISITDDIQLNRTSMTIVVGQTEQLSVKLNNIYDGTVVWSSSNPTFVDVNDTGLITGKRITTEDVIITATLDAGEGLYKTATCSVKVEATVSGFTISPSDPQQMLVGENLTVAANIKQTVTVAPLNWFSTNGRVFTVEQASDGKSAILKAVGGGTAELVVQNTTNPNERQILKITVLVPINQIAFKTDGLSLEYYKGGFNLKGHVTYGPNNATNTDLTWVSSDTSVVTLDADGYMTFTGPGTTLVSVYPSYNPYNVMASCLVTVIGTPNSMNLSRTDVTVEVGKDEVLEVEFDPANTATGITWTPNDPDIVSISYDEVRRLATLTGRKPGNTTINVVTTEGLIANVKVTVKQPSKALNLTPKELTLRTGDSANLQPSFTPADSTDTIEWRSYNTGVATVDKNGRVTGVKAGTTFIQATAYNGNVAGPTTVIQVIVRDGVKGVSLDASEKTLRVDSSLILTPIFNPETAFDKGMTWKASNGNIKLEAGETNVKVIGVKVGTALVTGTTADGGYSVSCLITVLPKVVENNTKVTVTPTSKYLQIGKSFYVTATVTGTSNKKVKWTSSKKSVATVTSDGKVKGKKIGTAYIKATARDGSGAYARCRVRVVRKVKKIKLNRYSGRLLVGNTMKLKATVSPKNATIKSVKWTTDKKSIATVSSSGRVLGVSEGIVKVKATAKDGSGKSATCIIRVTEPVEATGVDVANGEITVAKGKTAQSGITLNPANSTTKIKYHSDNPKVATVNKYGKIKTKRVGQATIYGTTPTGLYGYCDVLVVDLNRKAVKMRQYDTEQLRVNEISNGVTWYSKDINIATVSDTGLVTGRRKGTTTVYAIVNGVKLGCRVTIRKIK